MTLMHWLVHELDKDVFAGAKTFPSELSAVPAASKIEMRAFTTEMATLDQGLFTLTAEVEQTPSSDPLHQFLQHAVTRVTPVLNAVKADLADVQRATFELAEYFGEPQGKGKWEYITKVFSDFSSQFKAAQSDIESERVRVSEASRLAQSTGSSSNSSSGSSSNEIDSAVAFAAKIKGHKLNKRNSLECYEQQQVEQGQVCVESPVGSKWCTAETCRFF